MSGLNVHYGHSHALQGVDLTLENGVQAVVGRNGMGKSTLCKAIMGLQPITSGSINFSGESLINKGSSQIARLGVGYVPQGRRLWPTLTVDEHLTLAAALHGGAWTIDRIYSTFPRLAERKNNQGRQLSGGEQQMLAISRALLLNPKLLVMDEPTEGLAPVIVEQVMEMLLNLEDEGDISVLLIEQNISVATSVSNQVAIMVNGRVNRVMDSTQLAANRDLQQRLLGVGRHDDEDELDIAVGDDERQQPSVISKGPRRIYNSNPVLPTRWSRAVPVAQIIGSARTVSAPTDNAVTRNLARLESKPLSASGEAAVLVAGTLDTKGEELRYIQDLIKAAGVRTRMVDLSTSGKPSGADVPPHHVALFSKLGTNAVFTNDRGSSVSAMADAFENWIRHQAGIAGIISAGGSGGTALVTPAMRTLPVGIPKIMISTVASGDVEKYVGPADIMMMHSVADVQGLNSITRKVLSNGAKAMIGMVAKERAGHIASSEEETDLPAVGLTMFGVTTPCVQQVVAALQTEFDCLVFHATGVGGRSMEKLLDGDFLSGVIDLTTTEVCDLLMGGVFAATEDRFGAVIRTGTPYIGACGALDMVNFGAMETVPEHYQQRNLYIHNPQVTLMRTTLEENIRMGEWIGEKLNQMSGPVRFFLPEGGVSALDAPGQPFFDPEADAALFDALEGTVRQTSMRQLIRLPQNINDPQFSATVVEAFLSLQGGRGQRKNRG